MYYLLRDFRRRHIEAFNETAVTKDQWINVVYENRSSIVIKMARHHNLDRSGHLLDIS